MPLASLPFAKMHGCANDYVVVDGRGLSSADWSVLARYVCHRRAGVGADGLLLAERSSSADLFMRMYNPDGSQAQMCGNGLRCFVRYAREEDLLAPAPLHRIQTLAGVRQVRVCSQDPWDIEIDMGRPTFSPSALPARLEGSEALAVALDVDGDRLDVSLIGMGNPHAVHFVADVEGFDLARIGPRVEHHPLFPERVNFEIVERVTQDRLRQRTWERGAGETPACGTGACAVLVAAVRTGRASRQATIHLRGGDLRVCWADDDHVHLRGPAVRVFDGLIDLQAAGVRIARGEEAQRG